MRIKKSIVFSIEIIILALLLVVSASYVRYVYNPEYSYIQNLKNSIKLKTLVYSINNSFYWKFFNNSNVFFYDIVSIIKSSGFDSIISIEKTDVVVIKDNYTCSVFLYPLTEIDVTNIDIINRNCEYSVISREWYYVVIDNASTNNITISFSENLTIDKYSIFVFQNGIPLDIDFVNVSKNYISLSIRNYTKIRDIVVYFRNKTKINTELSYLEDRYSLLNHTVDNAIVYSADITLSKWKTILVRNCGSTIYIIERPTNYKEVKRPISTENCYGNYTVSYTSPNMYRDYKLKYISIGVEPIYYASDVIIAFPPIIIYYYAS